MQFAELLHKAAGAYEAAAKAAEAACEAVQIHGENSKEANRCAEVANAFFGRAHSLSAQAVEMYNNS